MNSLSVHDLLARSFSAHLDRYCIESPIRSLTYREVDELTGKWAAGLVACGFGPGDHIGVYSHMRETVVLAILSIIRLGGVFIPLDYKHPPKRLEACCKNAGVKGVLADISEDTSWSPVSVVSLNSICDCNDYCKWFEEYNPDDPLYIYFTSGSTGEPKPVLGRNKGLAHFLVWENSLITDSLLLRVAQTVNPSFDPFLRDVFLPLIRGGSLILTDNPALWLDPNSMVEYFATNKINLIHTIPSLFKVWVQAGLAQLGLNDLKYVFLAGEKADPVVLQDWFKVAGENCRCFNLYGPTETTLAKVFHEISPSDCGRSRIPVGKVLPNTQVLVLDDVMKPCPPLVNGRVFIRTPFRSLGYFRMPEENNRVFIRNPFSNLLDDYIYDTGDIGRFMADGSLDIIGRNDRQVKIRGVRIELGEIESILSNYHEVAEVAVEVVRVEDYPFCVAFAVPNKEGLEHFSHDLSEYCKTTLVEQSIPRAIVVMGALPRLINGKIDHVNLQSIALEVLEEKKEEYYSTDVLENGIERSLATIWSDILKADTINRESDFFKCGGNSIDLMTLISKIYEAYGIRLDLGEVFKSLKLKDMASAIESKKDNAVTHIPKADEGRTIFPLTPAQRRIFILQSLEPNSITYNMPVFLRLEGNINVSVLSDALIDVVNNYPQLRVNFKINGSQPIQELTQEKLELINGGLWEDEKSKRSFVRPFSLEEELLVRASVYHINSNEKVLALDMHHIIADGYSQMILVKEIANRVAGNTNNSNCNSVSYLDFAVWFNTIEASVIKTRDRDYWYSKLINLPEPIDLCFGKPRPIIRSSIGSTSRSELSFELSKKIAAYARVYQVSEYVFFTSAFSIFIARITDNEKMILGTASAGRDLPEMVSMIGMLTATLPLLLNPKKDLEFKNYLQEVNTTVREALAHQNYSFESIVDDLGLTRDVSRNPLFDVFYLHQELPPAQMQWGPITAHLDPFEQSISKFDLSLYSWYREECLAFLWEYNPQVLEKKTVEAFIEAWPVFLEGLIDSQGLSMWASPFASEGQQKRLLVEVNNTNRSFPDTLTMYDYFLSRISSSPDAIAVRWGDGSFTYRELDMRADVIASALEPVVCSPGQVVAVVMDRNPDLIPALLACWKLRACYLPVSPITPEERIKFILGDSEAVAILSDHELHEYEIPCFYTKKLNTNSNSKFREKPISDDISYVIYTSGSTGLPKGVQVNHRSLVNRLDWMDREYKIDENDCILQKTPITFDVSVWELFLWMISGATLYLAPPGAEKNPDAIAKIVENESISIMHFVPSMLSTFLNYLEDSADINVFCFKSLRLVFCSGEALLPEHVIRFKRIVSANTCAALHNLYGPTEATIDVSYFDCQSNDCTEKVPIGKPIQNTRLYVLVDNFMPALPGCPGELFISGVNVAIGYLKRNELTAERFMDDPFWKGHRMYRTGDKCRWNHDGHVEYLGRLDFQVKIRGLRIELGEIETIAMSHPSIQMAVAKVWNPTKENAYIALYCQMKPGFELDNQEIITLLNKKLPSYMVPQVVIPISEFVLGSTGKMDRNALPRPEVVKTEILGDRAPVTTLEKILWEIWAEVLERYDFGVKQDFFALGGNSLQVTKLMTLTKNRLKRPVSFDLFFKSSTVYDQALALDNGLDIKRNTDFLSETIWEPTIKNNQLNSYSTTKNWLVTGGSGFLGIHLIKSLVNSNQGKVIAILRPVPGVSGIDRFIESCKKYEIQLDSIIGKVEVIDGDIGLPGWGIADSDRIKIDNIVTDFVHVAADTRFMVHYDNLKKTNVESLKTAIEWAATTGKKMHYISTASVLDHGSQGIKQNDFKKLSSETGYVQSKWVADTIAENMQNLGLNVGIYRPGRIGPHSKTGVFQDHDLLWQLMGASNEISMAPIISGEIDLTPVDWVADFIAKRILDNATTSETVNILPAKSLPFIDFIEWINPSDIKMVSIDTWVEAVSGHAMKHPASRCAAILPLISEQQVLSGAYLTVDPASKNILQICDSGKRILEGLKPEDLFAVKERLN